MERLSYALVLLIALALASCETDIDVNAEPTDITVVYGLIDPADSVHYIKINKAFIGDANALDLAKNADNYNYTEDELNVVVKGNGQVYTLTRVVNEVPKNSGIFDNSTNVLYKFVEPSINKDATYSLEIDNIGLNKKITAETQIVGNSSVSAPKVTNTLGFWSGNVSSGNQISETVSIAAGANIGRIQAYLVFNYIEYYTIASGLPAVSKKVRMNLGEKKVADATSGILNYLLKGDAFFDNISTNVANPATIANFSHRELDNISIEYSVAGAEMSTYMEAEAPSTTVNQNKPNYTNLTNGIGIFSSRNYDASWQSNKSASTGLNIDNDTKRYLGSMGLGFCLGTNSTATNPCPY